MQIHSKANQQICEKCGKSFNSIYNFKAHEEAEHSETKPQPAQCTICKIWYKKKSGLRRHMQEKHEDIDKEHRCHICDKVFPSHRGVLRHVLIIHKGEYKYKCVMCDKAFKQAKLLKEHTTIHTGERLYTCNFCPMTFAYSANMYKHRQTSHKAEYAEMLRSKNETMMTPPDGVSNTNNSSSSSGEVQESGSLVHTERDMNYDEMQTNCDFYT